ETAPQAYPIDTLAGFVVAVIDDDAEVLDSTQRLLQRWGCRVFVAADAEGVLAHDGAAQTVQAVVADYRLRGDRTGVEAIGMLCRAAGRALPALIVSGDSNPQQLQAVRAGGYQCLSKPLSASRLRAWLSQAAARSAQGSP
ncbi:MAG: response regulator, partial [Rubrivivax sp.]